MQERLYKKFVCSAICSSKLTHKNTCTHTPDQMNRATGILSNPLIDLRSRNFLFSPSSFFILRFSEAMMASLLFSSISRLICFGVGT